ncbi:MAG: molybdopterin-dependent oxidoreductase [Collinsella sp.]
MRASCAGHDARRALVRPLLGLSSYARAGFAQRVRADGACEVSRLTGWEHSLGYSPASDLAHTDCIMYLGRSIVDSSTMGAVDALNDARRRGAKIIVVDPRRSGSAALADRWLRVRPGCDLDLLLGIAHVLIAEDLYDHEFVARYTTGFDELAQAAAVWTPEWAESMCDVPAERLSPRRAISLPPRLPPWWMRAFMAASASRMPTDPDRGYLLGRCAAGLYRTCGRRAQPPTRLVGRPRSRTLCDAAGAARCQAGVRALSTGRSGARLCTTIGSRFWRRFAWAHRLCQ